MKPETLKKELKKIQWFNAETVEKLPFSQGYLLNELIKHYKIPAKELGYHMDLIAVKTNMQIMAWKDTGIGARFLGLINLTDGSVEQHADDTTKQSLVFETQAELWKEIKKRDYDNIRGLKAKITEEQYMDMLEVLPPLKMGNGWFIMSEGISDGMYMKYFHGYCEVIKLEDEQIMELEA
jgi:hypothetical protein